MFEEKWIVYFQKPGLVNTEMTLDLARKRANELGIRVVIVTSTHGLTAQKALDKFKNTGLQLIVVGTAPKFFSEDILRSLKNEGIPIIFAGEVEYSYPELMRNALKKISEGMKVCLEVGMVAADQGLIQEGEEVIVIAGTSSRGFENGGGADTAIVLKARSSKTFTNIPVKAQRREILEIICKPR
ncbi:MAG: hypothetical protein JSV76_05525 [Candidatus Bathyarchaeota archaeon]|nr:MAG: hypothetical protein JSV76_05525 [Candidatus Bathyarchaeota archaeon]